MLWWSNQRRIRYGYNHLEWPPRIMWFIHSRNVFQKKVITFNKIWEECTQEEAQIKIREENMGETEDQALMIQRRYLKQWGIWRIQLLKNLLSILSIWIRNEAVMNEEDDELEGSRRSLPTKQLKISIWIVFSYISSCLYDIF